MKIKKDKTDKDLVHPRSSSSAAASCVLLLLLRLLRCEGARH